MPAELAGATRLQGHPYQPKTPGFVTAEEHSVIGGLGEAVAAAVAEAGVPASLRRVGLKDVFGESGTAAALFDKYGLRAANIAAEARALLPSNRSRDSVALVDVPV